MLQQINNMDMIPGEFYYKKYLFNNNFSEKVRMIRYTIHQGNMLVLVNGSRGDGYYTVNDCVFYRYISEKEYKEKRKEKYDATCLDIVLKRLVDELFSW
jgi:hypothetical protein